MRLWNYKQFRIEIKPLKRQSFLQTMFKSIFLTNIMCSVILKKRVLWLNFVFTGCRWGRTGNWNWEMRRLNSHWPVDGCFGPWLKLRTNGQFKPVWVLTVEISAFTQMRVEIYPHWPIQVVDRKGQMGLCLCLRIWFCHKCQRFGFLCGKKESESKNDH